MVTDRGGIGLSFKDAAEAFVQEALQIGGRRGKGGGMEWEHEEIENPPPLRSGGQASLPSNPAGLSAVALAKAGERSCIMGRLRYFPRSLMAKTSWINRNNRKRATVKKYAALRAELKAKKDYQGLSQLPRDASPTRVVNRCEVSGRRRAFIRRFKISRLTFRELASAGFIPGVTKSSW